MRSPSALLGALGYPRALLIALVFVTAVGIVLAASTSGAAFGAYNPAWDGATDLRAVADDTGADSAILLNTSQYPREEMNDTVAVVLSPDTAYGPRDRARIREFVRQGGTLVVAEDFGPHSNELLTATGAEAQFNGSLLRDERYYYKTPAMPIARNVTATNSSLLRNVSRLTLNRGTAVEPGNATVLVRSSAYAYLDENRNASLDDNETLMSYPVVTVEEVGAGRVVAVSDPSLFINVMLDQPDNREFTEALVADHERLVLDYSHAENLPPLAVMLIVVRGSPPLQGLLLVLALVGLGAWGQGRLETLLARVRSTSEEPEPGMDADTMAAYFERQHPEWDTERVRRVTEGVMMRRSQERTDD